MNVKKSNIWGSNNNFCNLAEQYPGFTLARVLSQEKNMYRLLTDEGECFARVSGKFRYRAVNTSDFPAVGDFVMADHICEDSPGVIHVLLPRKSVFIRKAAGTGQTEQVVAANIDTVFICMALNNDFNIRRMERYLSIAWESGAVPVVVLTKSDLCEELEQKRLAVEAAAIGVDILETSAFEKNGIDKIQKYLQEGNTVAFIGSSGVGKSTLINCLLGDERLAVGGLRDDDKGRHTTTHRELLFLPDGAVVIDTPGMREIGMWDSEEGIDRTFADIEELAHHCRFRDCTHTSEPGCEVRKALEYGSLSKERFMSYKKLKTENAYFEDSESYLAVKEKKFKEIAKFNRNNRKR